MDYAEELFNAVDILLKKRIETVKFDETIVASIIDDSKAEDGIYTVSTGEAKFIAYSAETVYHKDDVVLVTIPQGNYNNQKIIIGKQVDDLNTPMIYKSPFQSIVDISNNLIDTTYSISYWANCTDPIEGRLWDFDISDFKNSLIYPLNECCIWQKDYSNAPLVGYTRIGIKAQFSTWLSEYNTVSGNYGLALEIFFTIAEDQTKRWSKIIVFDSKDFFGDIYNFETYYTQEQLFDIEDYKDYPIVGLKLFAYQRNNFKDINGEYIPTRTDTFSSVGANIFIKDLYVCVGIPRDTFEDDIAEIYCEQGLTYTKAFNPNDSLETRYSNRAANNKKNIFLRWIHKDDSSDIIKTVEYDDTFTSEYKIFWYRYKLGAPSPDEFAGAHWERYYGMRNQPEDEEWALPPPQDPYNAPDLLQISFTPHINRQTEKIKAIILKIDNDEDPQHPICHVVAASNILEFNNDVQLPSQITLIDMNALSIRYEDDEKGHYFLYNEAGDIGKNEDSEIRLLTAVFSETEHNVYEKALLQVNECSSVRWIFPDGTANTMIVPMDDITSDAIPATWDAERAIWLDHSGAELGFQQGQVGFTIKKHLNNTATQNTIRLEIIMDGIEYTAQIQPIFGTAGLNGSDYTLILTWLDGKNALDISETAPLLQGELTLFDQAGNVLEWPEDATVTCDWSVIEIDGAISTKKKEQEDVGKYYPVFDNDYYSIMYSQTNTNRDNGYQDPGFYYFIKNSVPSGTTYYYFDLSSKRFQSTTANDTEHGQLYIKSTNSNRKNKLEFRKIVFTEEPLDNETGEIHYNDTAYEVSGITIHQAISIDYEHNPNVKKYYYSPEQRYYIKYGDRYIIDPWTDYQEVETYYEPIEAKETVYTTSIDGVTITNSLVAELDNSNSRLINIYPYDFNNFNMNSLFILQITLSNFGDYDLVTYYPIPLKNNQNFNVDYIEGPDRVRYDSSGKLDFNKNPYQITARKQQGGNLITYRHGYPAADGIQKLKGYWRLLIIESLEEQNTVDSFKPVLNETAIDTTQTPPKVKEVVDGKYDIPILVPISVFIPEAKPYGVQFVYTPDNNVNNEVVLWTQPILVYENRYPSRTLNKWNGKDIVTDQDAGTITASGFSAGKKERDNSFTGVVIGDWSRSIVDTAISKNTGIYGFYRGAMSYAFKDDGTGFIGKDGSGRIYFDGDKAQIFSSRWANDNNPSGMLLDIDDGFIKMNSPLVPPTTGYVKQQTVVRYDNVELLNSKILRQWRFLSSDSVPTDEMIRNILRGEIEETPEGGGDPIISPVYITATNLYKYDASQLPNNSPYVYINPGEVKYPDLIPETILYISKNQPGQNFITIDALAKTYPLAIGDSSGVGSRGFRVKWDGTTYINDGEFTGVINATGGTIRGDLTVTSTLTGGRLIADYLEVYRGNIGGWVIGNSTLESENGKTVLSAYGEGSITTGKGMIGGWTIDDPKLTSTGGTTILNANPGESEYNLTTQSANIGGWIVNQNSFSSRNNTTILKSTPEAGEANITTEYIKVVRGSSISGTIGYIVGSANDLIGIKSDNVGLAFEAGSNQPIRLSGPSGALASDIYVHGDTVEVGKLASTKVQLSAGQYKLILNSDGLSTDVPATKQVGIYARFA